MRKTLAIETLPLTFKRLGTNERSVQHVDHLVEFKNVALVQSEEPGHSTTYIDAMIHIGSSAIAQANAVHVPGSRLDSLLPGFQLQCVEIVVDSFESGVIAGVVELAAKLSESSQRFGF